MVFAVYGGICVFLSVPFRFFHVSVEKYMSQYAIEMNPMGFVVYGGICFVYVAHTWFLSRCPFRFSMPSRKYVSPYAMTTHGDHFTINGI